MIRPGCFGGRAFSCARNGGGQRRPLLSKSGAERVAHFALGHPTTTRGRLAGSGSPWMISSRTFHGTLPSPNAK